MKDQVTTLIVARPGRLRDGLRALLRATPGLELIGQADNEPAAMGLVTDHRPALVLLDSNLPGDEVQAILKQTKSQWPQIRCIVLANDIQQQGMARLAGADSVLLTGFSMAKFFAVIAELWADGNNNGNDPQKLHPQKKQVG